MKGRIKKQDQKAGANPRTLLSESYLKTLSLTSVNNDGQGWEGVEKKKKLIGWRKTRRVIILRRALAGDAAIGGGRRAGWNGGSGDCRDQAV